MLTPDPQCNGRGWLWQTPYYAMICWRCAGTGKVPDLEPSKEKGQLSPEAPEFDTVNEENTWGSEDESTQDA